ncbi:hypothetical protein N7508_008638 [Penicillium antarcticum]|uniref:uncharacterized protein n=1 Tax=Penicillium antarcticum TaxID=416450 RepID=UPI0023857BAA|nr:uncharacterized protein N7508_008638 [Penicillium antarcticum]KAJ5293817.1 hypothetical protein N7508_008638 [Penicillium antarcticum]
MFAFTVFGYRKDGMSEEDYHNYISTVHSAHLKALLAKNDIVSYTMQHNTAAAKAELMSTIYKDQMPDDKIADCDALVRIVFNDVQDYVRVREDPHFLGVVNPDHAHFANFPKTKFAMGWYEVHVADGQVVS